MAVERDALERHEGFFAQLEEGVPAIVQGRNPVEGDLVEDRSSIDLRSVIEQRIEQAVALVGTGHDGIREHHEVGADRPVETEAAIVEPEHRLVAVGHRHDRRTAADGGVQLECPLDLLVTQAGEAHGHAQQEVQGAGRDAKSERASRPQVARALRLIAEEPHAGERVGRNPVRERTERDEHGQRQPRHGQIPARDELAVTRPIEERRLRPGRDRQAAEDQRLFVIEPFEQRRDRGEEQQHDRGAKRFAIALRQSAREHEQQDAGGCGGCVPDFDERQRDELFEDQQVGAGARGRPC